MLKGQECIKTISSLNISHNFFSDSGLKSSPYFNPESEKKLCEMFKDDIVFIHSWPLSIKPFYILPKSLDKNEKLSKGFDALYGGIEISSGGQRVHIPEILIKQLKDKGLNP